jgi:hypothetical protein
LLARLKAGTGFSALSLLICVASYIAVLGCLVLLRWNSLRKGVKKTAKTPTGVRLELWMKRTGAWIAMVGGARVVWRFG